MTTRQDRDFYNQKLVEFLKTDGQNPSKLCSQLVFNELTAVLNSKVDFCQRLSIFTKCNVPFPKAIASFADGVSISG